jgi:hypothetical protein
MKIKAKSNAAESSQRHVVLGFIGLFAAAQPNQPAKCQDAAWQPRQQKPLGVLPLCIAHDYFVSLDRPGTNAFEQLRAVDEPIDG